MGLAMRGLTHCEKCGKTLNYDEYVLCRSCEKEGELTYDKRTSNRKTKKDDTNK